jgi:hypothetical protein
LNHARSTTSIDSFLEARFGRAGFASVAAPDLEIKTVYYDEVKKVLHIPCPFEDDDIMWTVEGICAGLQVEICETESKEWSHQIVGNHDLRSHVYFLYRISRLMHSKRLALSIPQNPSERRVEAWKARLAIRKYRGVAKPSWFNSMVNALTGSDDPIKALPALPRRVRDIWDELLEALLRLHASLECEVVGCFKLGRDLLNWRYRLKSQGRGRARQKVRINPLNLREVRTIVAADLAIQTSLPSLMRCSEFLKTADRPVKELTEDWLKTGNALLERAYTVFYRVRRASNARFERIRQIRGTPPEETLRILSSAVTEEGFFLNAADFEFDAPSSSVHQTRGLVEPAADAVDSAGLAL